MEQAGSYGQFELLRVFGRGLVTEVFLAREKGATGPKGLLVVHRVVASVAENRAFVEAFLDGAGVAGTIKHPNIVEIFDLGELEGQSFVAQEYVAGGSLHELLDRSGERHLPLGDSLFIVGEICAGLQFAHALAGPDGVPRNLVHGAVNPRHVLVSVDGVVKVADFGMNAAAEILGVPPAGDPRESAAYRAPEQVPGGAVDRRADIFACGALLYRLTTGQLPASGAEGGPARPRAVNPALPESIEEVIVKAMAASPRDRHPTCGALRRDLSKVARTLGLQGDMNTLGALVRSQFPEVVSLSEGEGAGGEAEAPVLAQAVSSPPKHFPAPDVTPEIVLPDAQGRPDPLGATLLADDVPLLADSEVKALSTGQFEALKTSKLPELDEDEAASVLAAQPGERPAARRPIWLWVAIAAVVGAILATGIVLVVIFLVVLPRIDSLENPLALVQPAPEPVAEPSFATQPAPAGLEVPGQAPGSGGEGLPGAAEAPKPPDQLPVVPLPEQSPPPPELPPVPVPVPPVPATPPPLELPPPPEQPHSVIPPTHESGPTKTAPVEPPATQGDAGAGSSPPVEPLETNERPLKQSSSVKGYLYILTSPTSKVYMDSRLLGTTPILKREVPAGRHSLVLVSPGFPSERQTVYVPPNKVTQVRHLFQR